VGSDGEGAVNVKSPGERRIAAVEGCSRKASLTKAEVYGRELRRWGVAVRVVMGLGPRVETNSKCRWKSLCQVGGGGRDRWGKGKGREDKPARTRAAAPGCSARLCRIQQRTPAVVSWPAKMKSLSWERTALMKRASGCAGFLVVWGVSEYVTENGHLFEDDGDQ